MRGFVVVDDHMRTGVPGVYVVGDLVPTPWLAHVGFAEAIVASRTIIGEAPLPIEYDKVPVGHLLPPGGRVQWTHRRRSPSVVDDVATSVHRFRRQRRAIIIGEPDGLVKIVAERDGPILGVHIAGPWATELLGRGLPRGELGSDRRRRRRVDPPAPDAEQLFGESAVVVHRALCTARSPHS